MTLLEAVKATWSLRQDERCTLVQRLPYRATDYIIEAHMTGRGWRRAYTVEEVARWLAQ